MSFNNKKPWEAPLTTEQMIENAPNWSLANDVALLKTLETFSENLFKKTQETDSNLRKLLERLDETGLKLNITKNEFLSLQNRQFVESRVYEDDETAEAESEEARENIVEKPKSEEEITKEMKEAVLTGLKVVEKYYYKSEVPANNSDYDSDDSSSAPIYALTIKDPYIDRPLPHIIGTQEWHKKWHVGLQESSSESENEATSEKFSDTDSESDLPISNRATTQVKISDTSSEERPVANSTFKKDEEVLSESSGSDFTGSIPVRGPISSSSFAEQLAAKLGNVINQQLPQGREEQEEEEDINKRPIQKQSVDRFSAGLFSDEPPPLDDNEEDIFEESAKKGLFSGGQGLFDDDETETLPPKNHEADKTQQAGSIKQTHGGLFDDEEGEEENDLFSASAAKVDIKKPFLSNPTKPLAIPLFNEEPPELDDITEKKKQKPVGGVPIFGAANLFEKNKTEKPLQEREYKTESDEQPQEKIEQPKKINLFDDDDNLFEDDLFSNITAKKFTSSLFDDVPPEKSSVDLFDPNPPPDTDDWETKSDEEKEIPPYQPTIGSIQSNIYNEEPPPLIDENEKGTGSGMFEDDLFSPLKIPPPIREQTNAKKKKLASLFDDDDEVEDDLFSNIKAPLLLEKSSSNETRSLFDDVKFSGESDIFSGKSLFEDKNKKLFTIEQEEEKEANSVATKIISQSENENFFGQQDKQVNRAEKEKNELSANTFLDGKEFVEKIEDFDSVDHSNVPTKTESEDKIESKTLFLDDECENLEKNLFGTAENENKKPPIKEKPAIPAVEQKPAVPTKSIAAEPQQRVSPGKLKHNLNINVGALMPGAAPPSFLVKSQSLEIKDDEQMKQELPVQSTSEISLCSGSGEEKPILFESEQEVETLKSVTKDRAKIPIKRRPSTRKARQEQIRRSVPDFKLEQAETPIPDSTIFTEVTTTPVTSVKKGKPLFTKEDKKASLFDSPDSDSDDMFNTDKTKIVTGDLFAKDDGLFGTRKPPLKKSDTIDIFNDGDDMEEIFSAKKLPPKSDIIKKSLFDDDLDDEDDIFGSSFVKTATTVPPKAATEIKPQKATIRKLNVTEMEDDPLDALKRKN